ncbi:histidinol-phosphate transaminase [Balneolaceae bacterium ANBcel3]|nr:histidinol-phosphate transaminase [Balneolaceae bacterium ANBcel3]
MKEHIKFNPEPLVRPNIRTLAPYHAARDDFNKGILLDANENSYGSVIPTEYQLHRYPETRLNLVRSRWAQFRELEMEQVFLGVGSDEVIDILIRVFCEPGRDEVMITPPTYGMYKVAARINNVGVTEAALSSDFQLDAQKVLTRVTRETKIIFLCSPNNPTGNTLDIQQVERILHGFKRLVVVDEAYVDFSDKESLCSLMETCPNLIVMQTLSKSFGLAGLRVGAALAHPSIVEWMMKVKAPYNINKLSADLALQAFDHVDQMKENVRHIVAERKRMEKELKELPMVDEVFPSDTNYLLIRVKNALEYYKKLASRGVIIRYRGDQLHCEDTLRITIGTPEENNRLLDEFLD